MIARPGSAGRRRISNHQARLCRVLVSTVTWSFLVAGGAGCIGSHFQAQQPAVALDPSTKTVVDRVTAERTARNLPAATWVADLRPPTVRAVAALARGDLGLKAAAHTAAQEAVTALGRHVWSFAAECTDLQKFRPPPMIFGKILLFSAAAATAPASAPGVGGHSFVVLVVAEPGTSALRADQMGGSPGGSNPVLETYVHPSVATGPCGESWPAAITMHF